MKSRVQFGLSVAGFLYFLLVFLQGTVRYHEVSTHLETLRESATDLTSLVSPEEKLDKTDAVGVYRRCINFFERSVASGAEMVVLQFQTVKAASSQEVIHGGIGTGLFAILSLLARKRRDES
ncbi:MAG: hypothetical protein R3F22_01420 [Lysobacteraceae bacterium]